MSITKAELLESIESDISANTTKLGAIMSTGDIASSEDSDKLTTYTLSLSLLYEAKAWVETNL
jgi:hypothetical protein